MKSKLLSINNKIHTTVCWFGQLSSIAQNDLHVNNKKTFCSVKFIKEKQCVRNLWPENVNKVSKQFCWNIFTDGFFFLSSTKHSFQTEISVIHFIPQFAEMQRCEKLSFSISCPKIFDGHIENELH